MITGSNTNVRYRGVTFHVQTEDSGRDHPHIISHVYHGGTILASEKREYGDSVDSAEIDAAVRKLIEEQHRSMVGRLKSGAFDDLIDERIKEAEPRKKPVVAAAKAPAQKPAAGKSAAPKRPTSARGKGAAPRARAAARAGGDSPPGQVFGEGGGEQRPLDELILEYLVQKARSSRGKG